MTVDATHMSSLILENSGKRKEREHGFRSATCYQTPERRIA
jgi:hypothetical protein